MHLRERMYLGNDKGSEADVLKGLGMGKERLRKFLL
jgi:hypothetical protein